MEEGTALTMAVDVPREEGRTSSSGLEAPMGSLSARWAGGGALEIRTAFGGKTRDGGCTYQGTRETGSDGWLQYSMHTTPRNQKLDNCIQSIYWNCIRCNT
jgi:hypothetical protein